MGILGILAAAIVAFGGVQTAMVLAHDDRPVAERSPTPVVEVQSVRTDTARPATYDAKRSAE